MGLKAKPRAATQKALPEEGLTPAICYQVLYLGHHKQTWNGKDKWNPKVRFTFELPELTHVFDEKKGEQPFVVSAEHNLYLNTKSNFYKFLRQWFPKLDIDENKEVDLAKLAGKKAMINVVHNEAKNGNTYANIGSIAPVMKGVTVGEPVNPVVVYDVDEHDEDAFQELPEWLQNKITESQEMQDQHGDEVEDAISDQSDEMFGETPEDDEEAF